jgi:outer membrane protein assembly factor BamE (lipoprotein component of BamABCDE complex)
MTQRTIWTALAAAALSAAPLRAQDTTQTAKPDTAVAPAAAPAQEPGGSLKPGMSEADVRTLWGDPVAVRRSNDWTYLFFRNGRERRVGTYDVVFLQGGQVVDAIVRGAEHSYSGQSSSPEGRTPEFTRPQAAPPDSAAAAVTGVRVKPGK